MMFRSTISVVTLALLGSGVAVMGQSPAPWDDATWKVNMAKSSYNPGPAPKSVIAKREFVPGGGFKITQDVVDAQGKATHQVTTAKYDGKENANIGAQPPSTNAYSLIDGGYENVVRVDGKVVRTNRFLLSSDGKALTQTQTGKDAQGQTINNTAIWEKQ